MRAIERTNQFKREYKRESKGKHRSGLDTALQQVIASLIADHPLAARYQDHPLTGQWKDFRDCHLRPDLVLIYRKFRQDVLQLVRRGLTASLACKQQGSTGPKRVSQRAWYVRALGQFHPLLRLVIRLH